MWTNIDFCDISDSCIIGFNWISTFVLLYLEFFSRYLKTVSILKMRRYSCVRIVNIILDFGYLTSHNNFCLTFFSLCVCVCGKFWISVDFRFRIHSIRQHLEKGRGDSIFFRFSLNWLVEWNFAICWFILIYLTFPFGWFYQLSSPSSSSVFSVSNFHCSFVLCVHQLIDAIVWIFPEILRRILSLNDISISTQALSPLRKNRKKFLSSLALPSIVSCYFFSFF